MVTLSANPLFHIGSVPITNTVMDTLVVDIILIGVSLIIYKNVSLIPGFFQSLVEMLIETFYSMTQSVALDRAKKIFPYVMSFFLFITLANWTGLTPLITGFGLIEHGELIPFVRSASTDLNFTLALAIISLVAAHSMSIRKLGFKEYISRFISLHPLFLFIGLLELVLEFAKIISFSFRLYGNVYVGKVLLHSVSALSLFIIPIPVMLYEMFIGLVQAAIFAMLTMAFMAILTTSHKDIAE